MYCKNYTLCLNNRFNKDAVALRSLILATKEFYPNKNFSIIHDIAPCHRTRIILPSLIGTEWAVLLQKHAGELFKHSAEFFIFSQAFKSSAGCLETSVESLRYSAECFKTSTRPSVLSNRVYENLVCKKHGIFIAV